MAVSNETMHPPDSQVEQEGRYRQTIIVGNCSTVAWRYMEAHGTIIEQHDELIYITFPSTADVGKWNDSHDWRVSHWSVLFDDDGGETDTKPGAMWIVIESELYPFESRVYAVPIPIVPGLAEVFR